jgi:aldose 1-epimerase
MRKIIKKIRRGEPIKFLIVFLVMYSFIPYSIDEMKKPANNSFPSDLLMQGKSEIKKEFYCEIDNKKIFLFTLTNANGLSAKITNYGGIILALSVPDKFGKFDDVVLGFDSVTNYLSEQYVNNNPHFGALIGRYANRIGNASFTLDGVKYQLTANSRKKHHIHGGKKSFDKIVWDADTLITEDGTALKLNHLSPDSHEGFPGNLNVTVIYTLTNDNSLKIDYFAEADKPTVVNFTNHSYFNLAGEGSGNILNHQIMINADKYTPVDDEGIPTGEIKNVTDTPFDFRNIKRIGAKVDQLPRGYDINYVLNHSSLELGFAAKVYEQNSGRIMKVFTTEPGIQFFTAKGLNGKYTGKSRQKYESSYGLCLETEKFPDSPNKPNFPSTVLRPGEKFHSTTIYKFSLSND